MQSSNQEIESGSDPNSNWLARLDESVLWSVPFQPEVYFSSPLCNENNKNKPLEPGYLIKGSLVL
jgi:hypothetical protein